MTTKIYAAGFYSEWKGHPISDLETFYKMILSKRGDKPIIYLAGDSSLDNKYWVPPAAIEPLIAPVPEIYHAALDQADRVKPDVAFWLNHFLADRATALNLAVEESMLRQRDAKLLPHDEFIRDHIREQDVLVVSVGGNDVAMKPTFGTIIHMLKLAWLTPEWSLANGSAWSLGHFTHHFGEKMQHYVAGLVEKCRPRLVIVCMIYFPLEASGGKQNSWADFSLKALGYNGNPGKLQMIIRTMFKQATKEITVEGTKVVAFGLYEVLDGKSDGDYVARVEPSAEGGRKIARKLIELVEAEPLETG